MLMSRFNLQRKMADSVVTFGGQSNLSGDVRADYLTVFTGEVLQAFAEKNVFLKRNNVKTITSGGIKLASR
jgi:hypothetical protein